MSDASKKREIVQGTNSITEQAVDTTTPLMLEKILTTEEDHADKTENGPKKHVK